MNIFLTAIQLLIGLISFFSFLGIAYYLYKALFVLITETSRRELLFFWDFKKYSQASISNMKDYLLKSGVSLLSLLLSVWTVHLIDKAK